MTMRPSIARLCRPFFHAQRTSVVIRNHFLHLGPIATSARRALVVHYWGKRHFCG